MSSNMLNDEEFQLMADWIYMQGTSKVGRHAFDIKSFIGFEAGSDEHYNATDEQISEKVTNAIRTLYNLNRLAICTRYGGEYERGDEKTFTPVYNPMVNERKIVNSFISLRYQCNEYIIRTTEIYKELNSFIGSICENIFKREN